MIIRRFPVNSSILTKLFNFLNPVSISHLWLYNSFNSSVVNSSFVKFVASNSISPVFNLTLTIRIFKNLFSFAFLRNFLSRIPFNLLLIQLTWIISSSSHTYFLWLMNEFFFNRIKYFEPIFQYLALIQVKHILDHKL